MSQHLWFRHDVLSSIPTVAYNTGIDAPPSTDLD
jgi:hypothetical protein